MGYHEYVSVKDSFQKIYGLDPDDETPLEKIKIPKKKEVIQPIPPQPTKKNILYFD